MKQLLLENPRRRHRIRRNSFGVRTPLSPLFPNGGDFEALFSNRKKRRKTRKGRKSGKTKTSRRRKTGTRRRTLRKNPVIRRNKSLKIRKNRGGRKSVRGFIGQFTNRENLSLAGGVNLAPVVVGQIMKSVTLPTIGSAQVSAAVYNLLIPGIGALVTSRFSPGLAKGMVIGGLAQAIRGFLPASLKPAGRYLGEYLDPARSMGAYIAPQRMGNFSGNASVPAAFNAWAK